MAWEPFGDFPIEADLSQLDKLLTQEYVKHRFTEEDGVQRLWLQHGGDRERVERILQELQDGVRELPNDEVGAQPTDAPSSELHNTLRLCPLTIVILLLGVAGYLVIEFKMLSVYRNLVFMPFDYMLSQGEVWRVMTPTFLHFDFMHILFNGLWVWEVGRRLELFLGKAHYLALFFVSGLVSNIAQFVVTEQVNFGGLSGVVYGYFAAIFILFKKWPVRLLFMPPGIFIFMLVWLALGFFGVIEAIIGAGIANWAHLGGLVGGAVYAALFCQIKRDVEWT